MKKLFSLLTLLLAVLFLFASCNGGGGENGGGTNDDEPVYFDVTVIVKGDGISAPNTSVVATLGEDLEIPLEFDQGYTFKSASVEGRFDYERNVFIIEDIPLSVSRVEFEAKTVQQFFFEANLESGDTSTHPNDIYTEGTTVTVTAGNTEATFIGWSFGKAFSKGGAHFY